MVLGISCTFLHRLLFNKLLLLILRKREPCKLESFNLYCLIPVRENYDL